MLVVLRDLHARGAKAVVELRDLHARGTKAVVELLDAGLVGGAGGGDLGPGVLG